MLWANLFKFHWSMTLGSQVRLQESDVANLVVGIVRDVLRHFAIKPLKRSDIGLTDATGCFYSPEFPILLPQISLDDLSRQEELQYRDISFREGLAFFLPERR